MRLQGQKTASFEIVDFLGDAPDVHVLPTGNAGNISAYWLGYREAARGGRRHPAAGDARLAGRGGRAAGAGLAGARPRDGRLGHPDRQPRLLGPRDRRRPTSRAASSARSPTTEILQAQRDLASRDGVFVEPASAAGVAGPAARGRPRASTYAGQQVVVTVTGHGLKDIDTALSTFTDLVDTVVRGRRGRGRGRGRARLARRGVPSRAGDRRGAGHQREPRPGVRLPRPGPRAAPTCSSRRSPTDGIEVVVEGEGADDVPLDESHLVVRVACGRRSRCSGRPRPGCGCGAATAIPHGRGHGVVLGGDRRRDRAGARHWSPTGSSGCRTTAVLALANRIEGHADNVGPALVGGFVICGQSGEDVLGRHGAARPVDLGSRVRAAATACSPRPRGCSCPRPCRTTDAAANTGRAALLVARARGPSRPAAARHRGLPAPAAPRPGRCRSRCAWSSGCAVAGCPR